MQCSGPLQGMQEKDESMQGLALQSSLGGEDLGTWSCLGIGQCYPEQHRVKVVT